MKLVPCPSCARHVKSTESACPFCRTARTPDEPARATPRERLSRAATFAFGAAVATSVAACSSPTTPPGNDAAAPVDASITPDANEATDAGNDAAPTEDAGGDAGYDAGNDAGPPDAGIAPPYGTPPEDGGVEPPYGAPPAP